MDHTTRERDKIDRAVKTMWEELNSTFSEDDRSSPAYIFEWNRIHAYEQVYTNVAFGIPAAGRIADAAVDAKTTVRVLQLVLERQARIETKIDQLAGSLKLLVPVSITVLSYLLVSWFFKGF